MVKAYDPLPPLGKAHEYSLAEHGHMTVEQARFWLDVLETGHGIPGAARWLVDSYAAVVEGAAVKGTKEPERAQMELF